MVKLTKNQISDVSRLKHVFKNNPDIAKDYYNQLIDGNPEPKVDEARLTDLWKSDKKEDQRDYYAHYFLNKEGPDVYDIRARKIPAKDTDIGALDSLGLGFYSGALKIGQGIGETVGLAVDIGSDWLSDKINKDIKTDALGFIEKNYPQIEMDNVVGKSTELITQYGTGYGIAKKLLEKTALKKGKAYLKQREAIRKDFPTISKIAEYGAPAALSEPFISTSRDVTLLQAFGLYDAPITRGENLPPEKKATNLLKQKLLFGVEGIPTVGSITVGLPVLAGVLGKGAIKTGGVASRIAGPVVDLAGRVITSERSFIPPTLRFVRDGLQQASKKIPGVRNIPPMEDWKLYSVKNRGRLGEQVIGGLNALLSTLRTNAQLTPEGMEVVRLSGDTIKTIRKSINDNMEIMSNKVHTMADEMTKVGKDGSAFSQKFLQEDLLNFVTDPRVSSDILPRGTRLAAKRVRRLLQNIKKDYSKIKDASGDAIDAAFKKDAAEYLSLSFKVLKEGTGSVSIRAIKDASKFYENRLKELDAYKNLSQKELTNKAEKRVNDLINIAEKDGMSPAKLIEEASSFLAKDEGFLKNFKNGKQVSAGTKGAKQEILPDAVRKLYGQVDDVRDRVLDTAIELGSAVAKKRMYDQLANLGQGKWLFNEADELVNTKGITTPLEQIQLGRAANVEVASSVNNLYTTPAIKQALEGSSLMTDAFLTNPVYRALLQLKGGAQISKTVLSPVTQIRNVTSAAGFALANGHFGKGASLLESLKFVWRDLFIKDGKFDVELLQKKMAEYTQEGIADSSLIQREIQLLAEDFAKGAGKSKITSTDQLFDVIYKSPVMQRLTKVYQSGDTLWKVYGYEFEKSRLFPILKSIDDVSSYYKEVLGKNFEVKDLLLQLGKKSVDDLTTADMEILVRRVAGNVIKNTYPNYNYVPTVIQNLRRLPIGNFISFPAEMMRTSTNIMKFGLNEMMSSNPEIRAIGAKRLIGFGTAVLGIDRGLQEIGKSLTEMTQDEMDGIQRSFAPSWNKEGPLMPISNEKENLKQADESIKVRYINTGYQNPYTSAVQGPFYVALNSITDRRLQGKELDEALFKGIIEGFGAMVEPFSAETIFLQNMQDVLPSGRKGKTSAGKDIYFDEEGLGDKIIKSISHVMFESLKPGVVDQVNKFAKAVGNEFTTEARDKFYSPQGKEYDISDEAAALFAGVRIYETDINEAFKKYEVSSFTKRISNSRIQLASGNDGIYNANNNQQEILNAFYDYQLRNYKIFSEFHQVMKDARTLGVSDEFMFSAMQNRRGLSKTDVQALMRGDFEPANVPSVKVGSRFQTQAKEKNMNVLDLVPFQDMNIMYYRFKQIPLGLSEQGVKDFIFGREKERYEDTLQQRSAVDIPITQPQATAATPQVAPPVATGTTQGVTPTETALLSPTELAIRQRNKGTT